MTGPIAPDALREAVLNEHRRPASYMNPYCSCGEPDTKEHLVDAVLAEVAKHRDAEVERLRAVHQAISECHDDPAKAIVDADRIAGAAIIRAADAESHLTAAQDRIARALAALDDENTLPYPRVCQAFSIPTGADQ